MNIGTTIESIKLTEIEVSIDNVRHDFNPKDEKVIELSKSIEEFEQLQPVVLIRGKTKHKLIIGQRRYYAIKHLYQKTKNPKWSTVKAVFISEKLDKIDATVVSLAENLHRVELSYGDMADAITRLYDHYKNVKKVAQVIGASTPTVYEYLKVEKFATTKMKSLLNAKKVSKEDVKRAMVISKGDSGEAETILKEMAGMSGYQKNRAVNARREKPEESSKKIMEDSKKASFKDVLTINLSKDMDQGLEKAQKVLKEERETIALNAIRIWLKENKFLNK